MRRRLRGMGEKKTTIPKIIEKKNKRFLPSSFLCELTPVVRVGKENTSIINYLFNFHSNTVLT